MNCAIEMTVKGGRLISYRQYMRAYQTAYYLNLSETFISALDNFVLVIDEDYEKPVVIEDIYIGYLDNGGNNNIRASWLGRTDDGKIYRYEESVEVTEE